MSTTPVALKSQEYTITFEFMGADAGAWPDPEPGNDSVTVKANSIRTNSGEELRDFSSAMDITELRRIIKSGFSLSGEMNLTAPNAFLAAYQSEGPLVEVKVTGDNLVDGAGANLTLTYKGIMPRPEFDFIANPGSISFEVQPYGFEPTFLQAGL